MSIFNDKTLKSVADIAAKIMEADLSSKQKAIAKLAEPKHKIDAGDLAKLRAGHKPVKEEIEQIDELSKKTLGSYINKAATDSRLHAMDAMVHSDKAIRSRKDANHAAAAKASVQSTQKAWKRDTGIGKAVDRLTKEEVELDEKAGYSAKAARAGEDIGKPGKMFSKIASSAAKRYGSEESGKKVAGAVLAKLRKEEKEEHEDEAQDKAMCKDVAEKEVKKHEKKMHKESTEQLQEYESKGGVYKHKGTYGTAKGAEYGSTEWDKENKDSKKMAKPASRKLGARQNFVRSTRVNESFTQMISAYQEEGLKSLAKMASINEEPDNEQFTKEVKDQMASFAGKKKQPAVAAPATQGVKIMPEETAELDEAEKMKGEDPCWKDYEMVGMKMKGGRKVPNCVPKNEEVEVFDANEVNGVTMETIEERTLTEPETKKKEEVVKSMKKKLPGFKERYGERAKQVLYATATKIAKEKA